MDDFMKDRKATLKMLKKMGAHDLHHHMKRLETKQILRTLSDYYRYAGKPRRGGIPKRWVHLKKPCIVRIFIVHLFKVK